MGPSSSLNPDEPPPPPRLQRDQFTAVAIPLGAVAAMIVLFGLWTTDRIVIPGYNHDQLEGDVKVGGVKIGSTDWLHRHVWATGIFSFFVVAGALVGILFGKLLGRLTFWGKS